MENDHLVDAVSTVWAKSNRDTGGWLSLTRHLEDSAAVAGRLWDDWLPISVRRVISECLPGGEADGRRVTTWLAGVHDIGKATPAFAMQVRSLADRMRRCGLDMPYSHPDRRLVPHATASQLLLQGWLCTVHSWGRTESGQFAVVVGGHHGVPPTPAELGAAYGDYPSLLGLRKDQALWQTVQHMFLDRMAAQLSVADRLGDWRGVRLPQTAQVLLTGIVVVADWIASNDELFPYDDYDSDSQARAERAWSALDLPTPWRAASELGSVEKLFGQRFSLPAGSSVHPVQAAAVRLAEDMPTAGLMVIEAAMGEGKTEAALAAAEVLAARAGSGGCFVALPTRATSDAMFVRVLEWLRRVPDADTVRGAHAVSLAHGKARFNEDFRSLFGGTGVARNVDRADQDLAAHQWLSGRKKAMLSSFVIGTIDQLLFGALKARHLALRHLGLAGKVVIIDEAHAYDVYMSQYLDRVLGWLGAYGVPTIVLSATLPSRRRKEMIRAYDQGRRSPDTSTPRRRSWRTTGSTTETTPDRYAMLDGDTGYPIIVASGDGEAPPRLERAAASGRTVEIALERLDDQPATLAARLQTELADGGCALVVRNTVARVQQTAQLLRDALAPYGIEVSVAHSRYLAPDRAANDQWLRDTFGPPGRLRAAGAVRPSRHVVVASQVAEQSLDVDFDLLATDLAPIDLVLQRMGRLHRHRRGDREADRPQRLRRARCLITGVDWTTVPPEPVSGSVRVYDRHMLLRALAALTPYLADPIALHVPADVAPLVQQVYGPGPLGPGEWQPAMEAARAEHERQQENKQARARAFLLDSVRGPGRAINGWLDGTVGDTDDDPKGRAQVRDTPAESVEAIVVIRRDNGTLIIPPWLDEVGGEAVPTAHEPPPRLCRTLATCTLALPIQLSSEEAIGELERNYFDAWQRSRWLEGQCVLVLNEAGNSQLAGFDLHYDRRDGLEVRRTDGS